MPIIELHRWVSCYFYNFGRGYKLTLGRVRIQGDKDIGLAVTTLADVWFNSEITWVISMYYEARMAGNWRPSCRYDSGPCAEIHLIEDEKSGLTSCKSFIFLISASQFFVKSGFTICPYKDTTSTSGLSE
jgi:hypothetical protein